MLSAFERMAEAWHLTTRDRLVIELLKMEIQLTAANEQIGALRAELEWERREHRRAELTACGRTR